MTNENDDGMELEETVSEQQQQQQKQSLLSLDCYPYTFSPLLLFAPDGYFDKGYSNYNAVAQFFENVVPTNVMLENVLYDRKNMLYEELLERITQRNMLVTCCIDSHFTAFQIVNGSTKHPGLVYYDPCSPTLKYYSGKGFTTLALFLLLKCNYADAQHIQEHKDHYCGALEGTPTRRLIYQLWKKINLVTRVADLGHLAAKPVRISNLTGYLWINQASNPQQMSTQLTSNTCYFQTYLFAVLCRVGRLGMNAKSTAVTIQDPQALETTTVAMCRHVLEFFVVVDDNNNNNTTMMRPLTNSNFVLDFYGYRQAPYYQSMVKYLQGHLGLPVPDYEKQYRQVVAYYHQTRRLHLYDKFTLDGSMSSTANTKSLQMVTSTDDDADRKLARGDYYKYRAANLMFGFNAAIMGDLRSFADFNALRKNQLLRYYNRIRPQVADIIPLLSSSLQGGNGKLRDYYFMPQFEVGQQELVDLHHFLYLVDLSSVMNVDAAMVARLHQVNQLLVHETLHSTSKFANYEKLMDTAEVKRSKRLFKPFLNAFLAIDYFCDFVALGFSDINPKEKEINSLTQSVFYTTELMAQQANRRSFEFEKECINQMARSNLRRYNRRFLDGPEAAPKYRVHIKIGSGFTFSKYNTLMHFLNVVEQYWYNPDLSNIQMFGKDIRALLAISSQKLFFDQGHCGHYLYGPFEPQGSTYREDMDLTVGSFVDHVLPAVARSKKKPCDLVVTDRVYEFHHLRGVVQSILGTRKERLRSDNEVLNLCLLSLMLDLDLYHDHSGLLNLPWLENLQHRTNTQELQVEVANLIYEFDRTNTADSVTRSSVEELLFECGYKFLVNKDFNTRSAQFQLIRMLNSDPDYQRYVLLVKVYMSLCQINKSVEVDFYKVQMHGEFRIVIPQNFSKRTSDYLIDVTTRYTFSERDDVMIYDDMQIFDLTPQQPEINLFKVRFDSGSTVQSMVKYIEISHAFQILGSSNEYLIFIADNVLLVGHESGKVTIRINKVPVEVATVYFNDAFSFIPCFTYADSDDVVLFTSRNIHYMIDKGGQFATDYYGMRHELIECITSHEVYIDLNDEHVFKTYKLSELLTESKTVLYYPDYLLQVSERQHLINLLDLAIELRNISFFILVLFYLRRSSIHIGFISSEDNVEKISGPWREAILYVLNKTKNRHYDSIIGAQFMNLSIHANLPLDRFIDVLCENFTKYQRFIDGNYQIIPTAKQKAFLTRIICADECFHFSEVGSGKTKVIMPLLCQLFLSNNIEAHKHLARGGKPKHLLVILVPEHLVSDARTQVLRYCLNLNFREEYHVYDDIFALQHEKVQLSSDGGKKIFVTSFNQFKKALTNDRICKKVRRFREETLVVADEVDDFLDRDKLVFNICSNKSSSFDRATLDLYFHISRSVYHGQNECPDISSEDTSNPGYWKELFAKFHAIHSEIQDASRSINKSFGIFNEYTLRHCATNIVHDIEGYKSLIARPYESVNRAMPGSYYSDVERTIYLTYVILTEDISKYDGLFQAERKYITFEYWNAHFVHQLEFDDLVYGHEKLSEIVERHPGTKDGLSRFLYEIILRRMEIRDKSRSVNSVDVIFNFDCIGFTGTPFLDNYPTFGYIRARREDEIPDMIDRSFYAYTSDSLSKEEFEERFKCFQGQNSSVMVQYVPSEFIRDSSCEMETLESIFLRQEQAEGALSTHNSSETGGESISNGRFNALVDLCGVFKQSTIHDVRDLIRKHFGTDHFHYIYHIGQADSSDRVLSINSDNDVQYDEDFYRYLCSTYGADLRSRVFFFVDNRNVIGKDIPFQLVYQSHYHQPLLTRTVVLAHDVDDWSKIWQAMGRSRTMNETIFSIYKSGMSKQSMEGESTRSVRQHALTRDLYTRNCDRKMAGNISSIYLTLIALYNLSKSSFYHNDEIVNAFLEKMEQTIDMKVSRLAGKLKEEILGAQVPARILEHILLDKFRRSASSVVSSESLGGNRLASLLEHIVEKKYERREQSGDTFDELVRFLSGEQESEMEVSYTKQQQKQKQKQQNKNQDSDAMGVFDKKNQLFLRFDCESYFTYASRPKNDMPKLCLNLPCPIPISTISYRVGKLEHEINIYPTLQFLYSHHIHGAYITSDVKEFFDVTEKEIHLAYKGFIQEVQRESFREDMEVDNTGFVDDPTFRQLAVRVLDNKVRQSPEYSLAGLRKGSYVIGMKDQFNAFDLSSNPIRDEIRYVADEVGFITFDSTNSKSVDSFGPYFVEQYILMEVLSKQEVAQNVLEYYCNHKETLQRGLESYDELQGKGFVSWRFLMNETVKQAAKNTQAS